MKSARDPILAEARGKNRPVGDPMILPRNEPPLIVRRCPGINQRKYDSITKISQIPKIHRDTYI